MLVDNWLDSAVALLPIALAIAGIVVSINAPKSHHKKWWYGALIICGVSLSALTFWQQSRARSAHATEVMSLTRSVENVRALLQSETTRRENAESHLAVFVEGVGKTTREGVVFRPEESTDCDSDERGARCRLASAIQYKQIHGRDENSFVISLTLRNCRRILLRFFLMTSLPI
jgi:hypothetical protein